MLRWRVAPGPARIAPPPPPPEGWTAGLRVWVGDHTVIHAHGGRALVAKQSGDLPKVVATQHDLDELEMRRVRLSLRALSGTRRGNQYAEAA